VWLAHQGQVQTPEAEIVSGMKPRILKECYTSHSYEPTLGDWVENVNPGCKHYQSMGVVDAIEDLDGDAGKVICYVVMNDGPSYKKGMRLRKTPDQLAPLGV